jgi:hypothetical protein
MIQLCHQRGDAYVQVADAELSLDDENMGILNISDRENMWMRGTEPRARGKLQSMIDAWHADPKRYRNVIRELISGLRQQQHRLPRALRVPRLIVNISNSNLTALRTGRHGPLDRSRTSMPIDEFTRLLFRDLVDA